MLDFKFTAEYFRNSLQDIEKYFPPPFMPVYVFSNLDKRRSIHRIGSDMRKAKLLHTLQLTVRGVPCMYYGEEIGMTNLKLPFKTALDPIPHKYTFLPRFVFDLLNVTVNRDEVRTPMQWDGTKNAGFSSAEKTWLPVHPNYVNINVETESKEEVSLLRTIQSLLKIRKQEHANQEGTMPFLEGLPKNVLGYSRSFEGKTIIDLLNFGSEMKEVQLNASECLLKLSPRDEVKEKAIRLDGLGGVIVRAKLSV